MRNMQQNKNTNNFSEIEAFAKDPETLTSSLAQVVDKFKLKGHLSLFDGLKSKGLCISSTVGILTILPFYGISSVYALVKSGIKISDIGKKDVYYDVKNNEFINDNHEKIYALWTRVKNSKTDTGATLNYKFDMGYQPKYAHLFNPKTKI